MKVIIVEVTRAANSFGQTHLAKIREAYELIAGDRRQGPGRRRVQGHGHAAVRRDGVLRRDRAGADRLDLRRPAARATAEFEQAKAFVVETICGGLDARCRRPPEIGSAPMDNDLVKRLVWSGLLAGLGALASIATTRVAAMIWRRAFGEDPPE